ncbi:MAG: glycine cleavage T C-terminal barrel domain-containing protein [Streptosporangiaceae bacterium]
MLSCGIALALVDTASGVSEGDAVTVAVRDKLLDATVVPTPFWPPHPEREPARGAEREQGCGAVGPSGGEARER